MNEPRSLGLTIFWRIVPATLVAILLILWVTGHLMHETVRREVDRRLADKASFSANQLDDRIELIRASVRKLADNDLIVNSIIDREQRSQQLAVFFRSLRMPSASFRRATLMDYRGRPIISTQSSVPIRPDAVLQTTMGGDDFFSIDQEKIIIASAVRYNGRPEAVIAAEYDTRAFLQDFKAYGTGRRFRLLLRDSAIYDSLAGRDDVMPPLADVEQPAEEGAIARSSADWIVVTESLPNYPRIASEQSESQRQAFASLRSVNVLFVAATAACVFALLMAIAAATKLSTQPLTLLISEITEIRAGENALRKVTCGGPLEFFRLAECFNAMIDSLSATTVSNVQLHESETRLRTVLETVPSGIVATDMQGVITLVNRRFEEMFGYSRSELLGQPIEIVVPEANRRSHRADRDQYLQDPQPRAMADRKALFGIHQSGDQVPVEIALSPVTLVDGPGVLASVVDVTKRREEEKKNEAMRRETQLILDSIPAMVLFKDSQNRILRVNQAAARVMGASPDEIEGQHSKKFFVDHEKYFRDDQEVMRRGQPLLSIIEPVLQRNGETHWASTDKIPIFDDQGAPEGIIAVINDITDLKRAEEAVEVANAALKRSNEELAQFAYVASHDLQEPLRKITSFCGLIEQDYNDRLDDTGRRFLGHVVDGATRMRTLIQDLLSFARIDSAGRVLEPVDLNEVVAFAIENSSESIRELGAVVTFETLPTVLADPGYCAQLFQNLIGNGIKYSDKEVPAVHVDASERDASWVISVADNGIGIEPQYFEQIFGVFKRLHSKDVYAGTGIGLAICKRIADHLNGEIWVESSPGTGSTFYVSIPKSSGED